MAAPTAERINARAATDKAFLARALKNPGLRRQLNAKFLKGPQKQQRLLNDRLNAPITAGSTTTERDLAHDAQAAQTVRYAPQEQAIGQQLGVAQATERDTAGFYDQYQAALQAHAAKVQGFQAGAQQALAATAQGITGLAGAEGAQMQQAANAQAAGGVAPAGDLTALASNAAATRQALMGSFQAQGAQVGAAANTYADARANVVAPGEKLAAVAQARGRTRDVRQKLTDLKTEEGAFNQQFRDTRRQDEFKNVLAATTLNVGAADKAADNALAATKATTTAAANSPAGKAATTTATEEAKQAAKYGMSVHQWRQLGPTARQARIDKGSGGSAASGSRPAPVPSYTMDQWNALSQPAKAKALREYKASKDTGDPNSKTVDTKAFRQKYGVDLQPTSQHNSARDNVASAEKAFGQVGKLNANKQRITTDMVVAALQSGAPGVAKVSPVWIRAALDIKRYGHITNGTAARIHQAGYSVGTLGFKTGPPTRPHGTRPDTAGNPNVSGR